MKQYFLFIMLIIATWTNANAISYSQAREEALYLTDKMAYELNLNEQQYNDAYEINLDYFLSICTERDLYGNYLSYRLTDFRHILWDWQYDLLMAADYFVRPIIWRAGGLFYPIYNHYNRGHFYYHRPTIYSSYRGGHGRDHYTNSYYSSRRPQWQGGLRDNRKIGGREIGGHTESRHEFHGNGYRMTLPDNGSRNQGYNNGRTGNRGRINNTNSFGNSSSRSSRNIPESNRSFDRGSNEGRNYNRPSTSTSASRNNAYRSRESLGSVRQSTSHNLQGTRGTSRGYRR